MKVALVHDYLTQLGGAEKVLENFQGVYHDSPVFVLLYDFRKAGHVFPAAQIKTSWLQALPFSLSYYQWYLPFMPGAVESLKLRDYDVILSSASSVSKGVLFPANSLHICYCHTPTRYLWHTADAYIEELKYSRLIKKIIPLFLKRLKHWDYLAAQRVDYFLANSRAVAERIKRYYGRESTIIYPPIDTAIFKLANKIGGYYLVGGRLVAYKRYDLAIRAFNKLGIKLKIFGSGPDYYRLKKISRANIEFIGQVTEEVKAKLMSECLAFLYPQEEDFGITAVEAMAAGRPVIAYRAGGALETVIPGLSGEFFDEQIWEALAHILIKFKPENYQPSAIKNYAEKFNAARFQNEIKKFVDDAYRQFEIERVFKMK